MITSTASPLARAEKSSSGCSYRRNWASTRSTRAFSGTPTILAEAATGRMASVAVSLLRDDIMLALFCPAQNDDLAAATYLGFSQQAVQVGHACNRLCVERNNDVS